MPSGYYRFPTIHAETVVFVCEDDLWTAPASGGIARRLTTNLGEVTYPILSPDGNWIAFTGREDGQPEIYAMPAVGGAVRRLTYLGSSQIQTAGWTADGRILFASNAGQPFRSLLHLYRVDLEGSPPQRLPVGPARSVAMAPAQGMVIGRNTADPARWKRYRGGTAGQLWIDEKGDGEFHPLIDLKGNLASPMWLGERIFFLSDHEGTGNLYSCLPNGTDLKRHSDHADFFARNASSDGRRIVYHAGADLFVFNPSTGQNSVIPLDFYSSQTQRTRKFVYADRYLNEAALHPHGHALAISSRSHVFTFGNWEGAVIQHGDPTAAVRTRLPAWLNDGVRLVAVTDEGSEEAFVILAADGDKLPERLPFLDTGRADAISVNPKKDVIAFSNHRYELCVLDLTTHELKVVDKSRNAPMGRFSWSPDGEWLVYSSSISLQRTAIKLWQASTGVITQLTEPVLRDTDPSFDLHGLFIYFLSHRTFDPVADNMEFDLNFPRGMRPYLITLQKDTPSPFVPQVKFGEPPKNEEKKDSEEKEPAPETTAPADQKDGEPPPTPAQPAAETKPESPHKGKKAAGGKEDEEEDKPVQIDLEGIQNRIIAFPVKEGRYGHIQGCAETKVFFTIFPLEGTLEENFLNLEPESKGTLIVYDFEERKDEPYLYNITGFDISQDGHSMLVRASNRLRVIKVNSKPPEEEAPGRKSGWVNLNRVRLPVVPGAEWKQMLREAWRLQRDQFWTPNMTGIDWLAIYERYHPLVDRVASRSEFSDLVWEMQGELSTSHCYELGGDYRTGPLYPQGSLGADFEYDEAASGWKVTRIVKGDVWDDGADSPLNKPGVLVKPGDVLLAINGLRLGKQTAPSAALVNLARTEVSLTFAGETQDKPHSVTVKTLGSDAPARYREWVETNRRTVHKASGGACGYIHIPDMGAPGYAEFHRGFLAEIDYPALIVDVRFNGGGNVSQLLLEKLARRRIGYDQARWSADPAPYPSESVLGPMVALTNENAGSDGDIFSHSFKLMGLGPLIGKRTWGGVIGIWPRHSLVDGTLTTQPEFSFWFKDVGWNVENYGTDPDIEVDNTPQDYARGVDAQLQVSIAEIMRMLAENPAAVPDLSSRPNRSAPLLPAR